MSSEIDWSKAPEGATHCDSRFMEFYRPASNSRGGEFYNPTEGEWAILCNDFTYLVRQPHVIARHVVPTWNGTGLPPVGFRCEAAIPHTSGPDNERSFIWIEGRVIAYYEIKGKTYAWFAEDDGFYPPNVLEFRPIRTPEQIAAEEREMAIDEMHRMIDSDRAKHFRILCEAIYDAGYRKTEGGK